eukprot:TRINITY_DN1668_c0_g1_i10.p1 TRINITY_DN1668_c0_g1~~TRINITY_DN1668_c0_g1_i10.p1  ORF type:complete len:156 (+),score=8.72 TRINITY_DN1668_c0_g1_i10:1054-1521(+)
MDIYDLDEKRKLASQREHEENKLTTNLIQYLPERELLVYVVLARRDYICRICKVDTCGEKTNIILSDIAVDPKQNMISDLKVLTLKGETLLLLMRQDNLTKSVDIYDFNEITNHQRCIKLYRGRSWKWSLLRMTNKLLFIIEYPDIYIYSLEITK